MILQFNYVHIVVCKPVLNVCKATNSVRLRAADRVVKFSEAISRKKKKGEQKLIQLLLNLIHKSDGIDPKLTTLRQLLRSSLPCGSFKAGN